MNTGTPIFKIHKIQHFVTICEKSFLKYPIFISKTTLLLKQLTEETIYAEINTLPVWQWLLWGKMLKLTPPLNANYC